MMSVVLQNTDMWERYLSKRVQREAVLEFQMVNGTKYQGVVTGVDHEWLQICTPEFDCINLNLVNITTVSDTGKGVKEVFPGAQGRGKVRRLTERIRESVQ